MGSVWQRSVVRTLLGLICVLALACPAPAPPPATPVSEPVEQGIRLNGQLLHPRDLANAPESVQTAWSTYQEAWAMEPPVPPETSTVEEYRAFASEHFGTFANAQVTAAMTLLGSMSDANEPEERLVHAVLGARILHRAASWMWTVPLPAEGSVNAAARRTLERTLREGAQPLAGYATQAYRQCARAADELGGDRASWRQDCDARAATLAAILEASFAPAGPPEIPESCADHDEPMLPAPAHDPEARPALLVQVRDAAEGIDRDRLARSVAQWARRAYDLRPVPAGQVRAAQALAESGRTERRGPECAAAPSLEWVLGLREHNLVIAEVFHRCETIETDEGMEPACELDVTFSRAGSTEGIPYGKTASVPADADTRALADMLRGWEAGDIALEGVFEGRPRLAVAPIANNPGYLLRRALIDLELHECGEEHGLAELDLRWTITPTGAVEEVAVEGGDEAILACVKAKLETLSLPCTPEGEPIAMSTRVCIAH